MKSKPFIYIFVATFLLVALFFVFKPKTTTQTSLSNNQTNGKQPTTIQTTAAVSPKLKVFDLVIKERRIVSGQETVIINQGDEILLKITADENEELHVHAYDNSVELEKDKTAELKFSADKSGRFPFELEKSGTELGVIEVQPK